MFPLVTSRLNLTQITEQEWPFFLRLQQDPDVMRYVSDERREAEVRQIFNSRLVAGKRIVDTGFAWVMRDRHNSTLIGFTGFVRGDEDMAEVGFILDPEFHAQGYGYESLYAVCANLPLRNVRSEN